MNQHFLSASSLNRGQIEEFLASAKHFARGQAIRSRALNYIVGLWFQDSSTRTRIGFEVAALRLGLRTFHISQKKFTQNMSSEESFEDTLRVLSDYSDLLCIRGNADFTKKLSTSSCPVINCGNGEDEHPTQALTDLFTIQEKFSKIDGLRICIVGDLKHMRTAHSLVLALNVFQNLQIDLISPPELRLPEQYLISNLNTNNTITQTENFTLATTKADVIYMAGFAPNTSIGIFDKEERNKYQLNEKVAKLIGKHSIVLCPLPRIDEITITIDSIPQATYFEQSKFGLFMRMAVLNKLLQ